MEEEKKVKYSPLEILLIVLLTIAAIITIGVTAFYGKTLIERMKFDKKVDLILDDDIEIESKWLIAKEDIPLDLNDAIVTTHIEQTYLCFSPEIRVRRLDYGDDYTFTVKTNLTEDGLQRDETEFHITKEEYEDLLTKKAENAITINKTRYEFMYENMPIAIDIFEGDLEGLAYLEVEFESQEEAAQYQAPSWITRDVTDDVRYKNGHLARFGIPQN